ncbi:putative 2-dehydropantoate 2-reductase [Xylogone sp. PMI_703]|nr:putative 2-dehydropantoate 2-reductase [Xylogone sp. PMI_703]
MSQSQHAKNHNTSGRIHILGIGNIGKLFAHALATQPNPPPITILLHRPSLLQEWKSAGETIEIITDGNSNTDGVYDVEVIRSTDNDSSETPASHIEHLILATKAAHTAPAIASIKDRLTSKSEVLFTQNGMGTTDDVNSRVFSDPATRPRYYTSVNSHGVYATSTFTSVHAGFGAVSVGNVLSPDHSGDDAATSYLVRKILESPILSPKLVPPEELFQLQLEKLVVNAMLNPLTALFGVKNGELFKSAAITRLMYLLLAETSHVISSLPELQHFQLATENPKERFSSPRLAKVVFDVAEKTAKNTSSMLQDARAGRETEIDFINGWIVRRGSEMGIDCHNNEKIVQLVKARRTITEVEIGREFDDFV